MTIYLIIAFLFYFLTIRSNISRNTFIIILSSTLLVLVGAYRGISVGTDTKSYLMLYDSIVASQSYLNSKLEPGYIFINTMMDRLGFGFQGVLFCSSVLVVFPLTIAVKRNSTNPMLSMFLFLTLAFYFYSFNTTRQSIAMSIMLLGTHYLVENNNRKFLLCLGTSLLFHYSAIFTLSFLLIKRLRLNNFIVVIYLVVFSYLSPFVIDILSIIKMLTSLFGGFGNYENYLVDTGKSLFSINRLLLNIFFIFIYYYSDRNSLYVKLLLFGILIFNLFPFSSVITRNAQYFIISQIILYPNLLAQYKHMTKNHIILYLAIIIYSIFIFLANMIINNGDIVPYVLSS